MNDMRGARKMQRCSKDVTMRAERQAITSERSDGSLGGMGILWFEAQEVWMLKCALGRDTFAGVVCQHEFQ